MHPGMRPPIILLRDGTDTSQGKGQLISNINACQAVGEVVRTTLGELDPSLVGMRTLLVVAGERGGLAGSWMVAERSWHADAHNSQKGSER